MSFVKWIGGALGWSFGGTIGAIIGLAIGSMLNKQRLIEEAAGQGYNAMVVSRVLSVMAMQGELLERNQGRLLKRIK